jgi:hypothetical protein
MHVCAPVLCFGRLHIIVRLEGRMPMTAHTSSVSAGAITGLVLSCAAWLLAASLVQVIRLNPFPLLSWEAKEQLDA